MTWRAGTLPTFLLAGLGAALAASCSPMLPDASRPGPTPYAPGRPEAPLVGGLIDRAIDGETRAAVLREGADLNRCVAELTAARVNFSPRPDQVFSENCHQVQAGLLGADMGTVARMSPGQPEMTCRLALAVSIWRRQSLEPAAREILGSDIVQIDHFGAYACRNVNNGVGSTRVSAHAQAAALDVAGVRLRDGRRISLTDDWHGDGPEARFLRRIRDDACRIFGTVLSPDYNAVHQDHLHLEATDTRFCR